MFNVFSFKSNVYVWQFINAHLEAEHGFQLVNQLYVCIASIFVAYRSSEKHITVLILLYFLIIVLYVLNVNVILCVSFSIAV